MKTTSEDVPALGETHQNRGHRRAKLPQAVFPKFQAALDEFTVNEFWREDYEDSPLCVKVRIELGYYYSWYVDQHGHEPAGEEAAELERISRENTARMKRADWLYLADHCHSAMERCLARPHYLKAAEACKE